MKRPLIILFSTVLCIKANPELFRERFADPSTRSEAIAMLTPGTRDFYFHTALHQQLLGKEKEYKETISAWESANSSKEQISTEGMDILESRRMVTLYDRDPKAALTEMIRALKPDFNATRPDSFAEEMALPTSLDPELITAETFRKLAELQELNASYTVFSQEALYTELNNVAMFPEDKIRWFSSNFKISEHPNYVALLTKGSELKPAIQIDTVIFKSLSIAQMDELRKAVPAILSNQEFNIEYLSKLKPVIPKKLSRNPKLHADYFAKCLAYIISLPPANNELKAHVLYHYLRLQQTLGNHPKDEFLAYLKLPRRNHDLIRPTKESQFFFEDMNELNSITETTTIVDDSQLIESYLSHFLALSDTPDKDLIPLIQEKQLTILHARARILAGGNSEKFATILGADHYNSLRDEIRIGFAPTIPQIYSSAEIVSLPLDLKNTPTLLIRIYELDEKSESSASVDLDGLVPHHTRSLQYTQAPAILHREAIALPELNGAGSWIVEFVAERVSARALIRKGNITPHITRTATGQEVRLYDETAQQVTEFNINLGSENFPSKDGIATIPNSPNQPLTTGTITAGKLTTPLTLESRTDSLELKTSFLLDREQLLANQEATLQIRNQLTNHGQPLPLDKIKNATITLKAKLLGGVVTDRVIADSLTLAETNAIPFLVPADLLSLTITLSGTVTPQTSAEPLTLFQSETYDLNHSLLSSQIAAAYFSLSETGHRLEIRGRNGEALPNRPISLSLNHKLYKTPITTRLRTDQAGRIDLGKLQDISSFTASSSSIRETTFHPPQRHVRLPSTCVIAANETLRIPLLPDVRRNLIRLPDRTAIPFQTQTDGHLTVKLPSGSYLLTQDDQDMEITVFPENSIREKCLVTPDEISPIIKHATPTIASAKAEGENIAIRVAGASPETRVTVIARRYQIPQWFSGSAAHPFASEPQPSITRSIRPSSYLTDRRLSDEVRYILNRRSAKVFPGSMLPRPGQLLYPWTPEDINQNEQNARDQMDGHILPELDGGGGFGVVPARKQTGDTTEDHLAIIDFLAFPSAVQFNLKPDDNGNISIPIAKLVGSQFIEIIAADIHAADTLYLPLPASDTSLRDQRLARPLEAKSHHVATRYAAALSPNAEVEIRNLLDADWRAFTTLEEAYQFLFGSLSSDNLRRFSFLPKWPTFDENQKLTLLKEHDCHELHLFLARKDKEFFEKHVKPFLSAKTEPKFIDDYLLARDLSRYLRPNTFSRLNAAEKALLAQAIPAFKTTIARELELRWQVEAPLPDAETLLFTKTLKGADLSNADSLGFANRVDEVRRNLYVAQGNFDLGKFDDAKKNYESVLRIDPYNTAARRGMEMVAAAKTDYYRAAYDQTRAELLMEVDQAWDVGGIRTLGGSGLRSGDKALGRYPIDHILSNTDRTAGLSGALAIHFAKLRNIIIPNISFKNTSIGDALGALRVMAHDFDKSSDTVMKGISMVYRPSSFDVDARIDSLELRDVPLGVVLKYICESSNPKHRYYVDGYGVKIVPQTETGEDFFTRTFRVPPDFAEAISAESYEEEIDPFAGPTDENPKLLSRAPIVELLKKAGIVFPEGSSAVLSSDGNLIVTSTSTEMQKIEQLVQPLGSSADSDEFAATGKSSVLPPLFADRTRLWLESGYFRNTGATDETLIPLNRFWLELSMWNGQTPFTSPHFNTCTKNTNDALMCLAMLDLPFKAEKPKVSVEGSTLKVKALAPMLLFYKDTRETQNIAPESPLLVRQSYHPLDEPFRTENGKQLENTIVGDFRTGTAYGISLVITNPTGMERRIETLAQIPAGSIPLAPNKEAGEAPTTLSTSHDLQPYGVIRLQLAFYFPAPGDYTAYPLHVSENATILAHAQSRTLRVSAEPPPEDSASWQVLARDGTPEAVLSRLATENLSTIDLDHILWRVRDKDFFLKATAILRQRLHMHEKIFLYALQHNDPAALSDLLENDRYSRALGSWFTSKLVSVTPSWNHDWQTKEFDPLINPRAHSFGENPFFSHPDAHTHYKEFLDTLAWKPSLTSSDQLTYTLFLFLQDRIEEALTRFAIINPAELPDTLQYDYLHAVALFHQEKPGEAKAIALPYSAKLPPGIWKDRYNAVIAQADEIAKPIVTFEEKETDLTPTLEIAAKNDDSRVLTLKHANSKEANIRLFHIDLEILFSKDPFFKGNIESSLPPIAPNLIANIPLEAKGTTEYALPEDFRKGNILVSAEAENVKQLKILDSQNLEIRTMPTERSIQIIDPKTSKALAKTYIKVYAESSDGNVSFHKDGYTDLRGKFDYFSHTTNEASNIRRLAILVSHPENGTRTTIINR